MVESKKKTYQTKNQKGRFPVQSSHHLGVTRGKGLRPLPQAHEKTRRQTGRTLRRRWWGVIGRGQEGTIAPERYRSYAEEEMEEHVIAFCVLHLGFQHV